MPPFPTQRASDLLHRGRWAILLLGVVVSVVPAYRAARSGGGYDVSAYIGAGYALEAGRPIYAEEGSVRKMKGADGRVQSIRFPPFLYHPILAMTYQGMLRASGFRWPPVVHATNLAGFLLLSIGFIAILLGAGARPWAVGIAQAVFWWSPMAPFPLVLGNLGPVVAGLILLGGAALVRNRWALAGVALGLSSLFKPTSWLLAIALAGIWRPARRRNAARLFLAWGAVQLAAALVVSAGPGLATLGEYGSRLRGMGARAWSMTYYDGSLGASVLRSISPWRPSYHEMVVHAWNPDEAVIGKWRHEDLGIMQAANALGLVAFAAAVFWRRRDLANEPVALSGLAVVAGFLFQPANWPHNYGMLAIVPAAILHMRMRARENAEARAADGAGPEGGPVRRSPGLHGLQGARDPLGRLALASALLFLLMMWPVLRLVRLETIRRGPERTEEPLPAELAQWHFARIAASLPSLWLPGLAATLFLAAAEFRRRVEGEGVDGDGVEGDAMAGDEAEGAGMERAGDGSNGPADAHAAPPGR